ncbi:MFS transporter [Tenacibaculum maritimum]|uniref:MFS transporter n=1 Tax=Tenacibaculum maritimum TaxID=107401 RepID=UPI001E53DCEC|nr:MFS transporter [Tenacibaculum maritimum]MCD9581605.1 MFS transporter [Tenacibaculum maritimum]MCD9636097.1 MFS transporter [Tenacibaculum maritimum]
MLVLIIAGEAIFLLPFILMRVFKPIIREVFLISDAQIGEAQALYGITGIISYFIGGFIADKWEARKLLSFSLLFTALGGLFAALISLFGATILTSFFPTKNSNISLHHKIYTLQYIIGAITLIVFSIAFLTWKKLPKNTNIDTKSKEFQFNFSKAFSLIKKPEVIYHSLIIFCAYCSYKLTGVYGTYAKDVWNFSLQKATYFAVFIQFIRPLAAISIGWLADKLIPSILIIPCFFSIMLSALLLSSNISNNNIYLAFLSFVVMALGTYSLRGLYFAIIEETKTPIQMTGTLVGIISVIGFAPDIFMSLFIGYLLGENPTILEYQKLFSYFSLLPFLGLVATLLFRKEINNETKSLNY